MYLFSGYFLLRAAFTDHRVLGTDLVVRLRKRRKLKAH